MSLTWMDDAACIGLPLEIFFPSKGESITEARAVCGTCTARLHCLAWAMTMPATDLHYGGVLAGLAPRDLSKLRGGEVAA